MTCDSKQIVLANIEHRGPPRPALTFNNGRMNDMSSAGPGLPKGYTKKTWVEGEVEYTKTMWGTTTARMINGCGNGETCKAAIEEWPQLPGYQPPVYDLDETADLIRKEFEDGESKFKLVGMPGWVFAASREIRRLDNYLMDMLLHPEEVKLLHSKVAGVFETLIRAAGKAGADGFILYEDMGTQTGLMFSPDLWEEFFGPLYRRLFGMAHELGMKVLMHSCGQNREILEPLLEAGIDCFQFDQPTAYDMPELASLLKKRKAAIWSPIDIQKILPTGDRRLIERGVDEMFDNFEGFLMFKNYPDLKGIGVQPEWDNWAYERILQRCGL